MYLDTSNSKTSWTIGIPVIELDASQREYHVYIGNSYLVTEVINLNGKGIGVATTDLDGLL